MAEKKPCDNIPPKELGGIKSIIITEWPIREGAPYREYIIDNEKGTCEYPNPNEPINYAHTITFKI